MAKYEAEKEVGTPIKARPDTYDYIVAEARRGYRTNPRQLDLFVKLHAVVKEETGMETPDAFRDYIRALKKKAEQGK